MIYAGIDIAKLTHFSSVVSSHGEVLVEPFQFSNDFEDFPSLSSYWIGTIGISSSLILNKRPNMVII